MANEHDISGAAGTSGGFSRARSTAVRAVLWMLLGLSATGTMVTSTAAVHAAVGVVFGLATLACATALIVQHRRNRRRQTETAPPAASSDRLTAPPEPPERGPEGIRR